MSVRSITGNESIQPTSTVPSAVQHTEAVTVWESSEEKGATCSVAIVKQVSENPILPLQNLQKK